MLNGSSLIRLNPIKYSLADVGKILRWNNRIKPKKKVERQGHELDNVYQKAESIEDS